MPRKLGLILSEILMVLEIGVILRILTLKISFKICKMINFIFLFLILTRMTSLLFHPVIPLPNRIHFHFTLYLWEIS
jgi:hypothetical protein